MRDADSRATSRGRLLSWRRFVAVLILVLIVAAAAIAAAYYAGYLGAPTAGIEDRGDWGNVSDERTEVITTVWVDNPNPVGERVGDELSAEYAVTLNGVPIAQGNRSEVPLPPGNNTFELRSTVDNDRLDDWWVAFLRDDETVHARVDVTARADAASSVTHTIERNQTMMADERPVSDALNGSAREIEGEYTHTITVDRGVAESVEDLIGRRPGNVTVGYEIRRAWATWGEVSADRTTVVYHLRVRNPGDVPVLASPQGVRATVAMNDVTMLRSNGSSFSLRDVGPEEVLEPGESRTLAFALTMDNDDVDEWFTSHVRRGERSNVTAKLRLLFENPINDETIRVPGDSPVTYSCSFRTAILVDNQTTGSDCGNASNASNGEGTTDATSARPISDRSDRPAAVDRQSRSAFDGQSRSASSPRSSPGSSSRPALPSATSPRTPPVENPGRQ